MVRAKLLVASCGLLAGDWIGWNEHGDRYCRANDLAREQRTLMGAVSEPKSVQERGLTLCRRGYKYMLEGDDVRGHELLSEAAPYLDSLPASDTENAIICKQTLAVSKRRVGRFEESYKLSQDALATAERKLGMNHPVTAQGFHNLAMAEMELGKVDQAQAHFMKSIELNESCCGAMNADVIASLTQLGETYRQRGDPVQAERFLRRALQASEKIAHESVWVATALEYLARLQYDTGAFNEAEKNWRRSFAILEPIRPANAALILMGLGEIERLRKRSRQSEELLHRAVSLLERSGNRAYLVYAWSSLGAVHLDRGNLEEAEAFYRRSLALAEQEFGPTHPQVGVELHGLSRVLAARKFYADAEPPQRRAIEVLEQHNGPRHRALMAPLAEYAALLRKLGRKKQAAAIENRVREIKANDQAPAQLHTVDIRELSIKGRQSAQLSRVLSPD